MTDSAEWLRRHPEIVEAFAGDLYSFWDGSPNKDRWQRNEKMLPIERQSFLDAATTALTKGLPAILKAHEADLAGLSEAEVAERAFAFWQSPECDEPSEIGQLILRERAAAYLAGRQKGREEAAPLQDSAYIAGAQRGFRLGLENDNDGMRALVDSRAGYLAAIRRSLP